jgi:hypothetical protein
MKPYYEMLVKLLSKKIRKSLGPLTYQAEPTVYLTRDLFVHLDHARVF